MATPLIIILLCLLVLFSMPAAGARKETADSGGGSSLGFGGLLIVVVLGVLAYHGYRFDWQGSGILPAAATTPAAAPAAPVNQPEAPPLSAELPAEYRSHFKGGETVRINGKEYTLVDKDAYRLDNLRHFPTIVVDGKEFYVVIKGKNRRVEETRNPLLRDEDVPDKVY